MNIKIEGWKVTIHNENGDRLELNGEFEAGFFKEYENEQLIIGNVVGRYSQKDIEEAYDKGREDGYACSYPLPSNM